MHVCVCVCNEGVKTVAEKFTRVKVRTFPSVHTVLYPPWHQETHRWKR